MNIWLKVSVLQRYVQKVSFSVYSFSVNTEFSFHDLIKNTLFTFLSARLVFLEID